MLGAGRAPPRPSMGSLRFGEWLLPVAEPQRPQAAPHCAALCPAACCPPCIRTLAALHLRLTAPPTFCCISADAAASALLLSHGRRSRCWHRGSAQRWRPDGSEDAALPSALRVAAVASTFLCTELSAAGCAAAAAACIAPACSCCEQSTATAKHHSLCSSAAAAQQHSSTAQLTPASPSLPLALSTSALPCSPPRSLPRVCT